MVQELGELKKKNHKISQYCEVLIHLMTNFQIHKHVQMLRLHICTI